MKKEFAIAITIGLVLLIALMPYASATTSVRGPYVGGKLQPADTVPLDSSFTIQVKTDQTVEAAHINITFPSALIVDSIAENEDFDLNRSQSDTTWVDFIFAQKVVPLAEPTLAEIGFTATEVGIHIINLSSVINRAADSVESLTITVVGVPGDVTGDGIVNYWDLAAVIEYWGEPDTKYDVDRSGTVGYSDITFILDHWTG